MRRKQRTAGRVKGMRNCKKITSLRESEVRALFSDPVRLARENPGSGLRISDLIR